MMRWIIRIFILLLLLSMLFVIFAPSIGSTTFGKQVILRFLKIVSGYDIQAQELKLQWTKGQTIQSLDVMDSKKRVIFHADSLKTSAPLWKLLIYHDVGALQVQAPSVVIHAPEELAAKLAFKQASFFPSLNISSFVTMSSFKILGEISVVQGSAQFIATGLPPISAKDIQLDASFLPQQIKVNGSGLTQEGTDPSGQGTFQIQLMASPGSDQIDASLQLNHFPLRAADQIIALFYPHLKGVIGEIIGDSLNADLKLKNLQDTLQVFLDAHSNQFSAHLETKLEQDIFMLASPATMQLQIGPKAFEQLTAMTLKKGATIQVKLDELSLPLQNRSSLSTHGTLKSDSLEFENWTLDPFSIYVGNVENTQADWNIKMDSPQVQLSGSIHLAETWQGVSFNGEALLPQNTKLDISAPSLKSISIVAQGDLWKGKFKAAVDPIKKTVALIEPGYLSYALPQLPSPLPPLLKASLPIQVSIDPFLINLQSQAGSFKGKAITPPFELGLSQIDIVTLQFSGDLKTRQAQFSLITKVDQGPLSLDGTFSWPSKLSFKGSCKDFPIASIQPFLKEDPPLLPLLGNTLTTLFQTELSETSSSFQIHASSPQLSLQVRLKKEAEELKLLEPASFTWNLTSQGYQALMEWLKKTSTLSLSEAAIFKGTFDSLTLPLKKGVSLTEFLNRLQYQVKISSSQLTFTHQQQTNQINPLQIQFSHRPTSPQHQFQIIGSAAPQGTLSCKGSWTPAGTADVHLLLDQFPSASFDLFLMPFKSSSFSLTTLCGPLLNLTLDTTLNEWTGPVKFKLYSANFRSSLQGALNQGTLTLADTFHLQLQVTPPLSQMLFQEANPLSLSSVRSLGPITLEISPQGFSYPLTSSDLSKIQLGSGKLELGKLLCKNEGNIQVMLGLLKLGQYQSGDELKLWFAPLDFHIQDGVMDCERTEILIADSIQICLWGLVDLPNNFLDGVLGLTASCLKKAFGIKNLPEDYVLQIPLQGTLTDVQINKGKAATKIGALLLWQQKGAAAGAIDKGPAGALLGEMLNKLGPLPGGDQKAPPAKKPFPWDTEQPTPKKKHAQTSMQNRKLIHPEDSALKQVLQFLR